MEIIDAYTHCGLHKYQPIAEVRRVMGAADVRRAVLVQHLGEFDNSYIESIVAADPEHFAGVCLVNHEAPDCVETLEHWTSPGHFTGIRLTTTMCAATPRLWHAAVDLGLIIVLYAPEGIVSFTPPLAEFLRVHSDARLVITHLGNPNLADAPDFPSYRPVFRLAEYPGVHFQVSGMKMFCPYPHEPLYKLVAEAGKRFGPSRLGWGSNYPVVGDEEDYRQDLRLLLDGKLSVPAEAVPAVAGANTRRLWFPKS